MQSTCSVEGCAKPVHCRKRCSNHYRQLRRTQGKIQNRRAPGAASARDQLGRKHCIGCELWLPETDFGVGHERYSDRLQSRCKSCTSDRHRLRKYGLTARQIDNMIALQGGLCAICDEAISRARCAIDHDHACCSGLSTCGTCVRGVLCRACNSGLGLFNDNINSIARALEYLTKARSANNGIEIL